MTAADGRVLVVTDRTPFHPVDPRWPDQGPAVGRIAANGVRVPLHGLAGEAAGARALGSVTFRAFVPRPGLHPNIAASDPLTIEWQRGER